MINVSLEKAMEFAKENGIPRVIEIQCPRCKGTVYALTDNDKHEHRAWMESFKKKSLSRFINCKHCGYGATSSTEGNFAFKTHQVVN